MRKNPFMLLPFVFIFMALSLRNIRSQAFDATTIYVLGVASGAALALSCYAMVAHFRAPVERLHR